MVFATDGSSTTGLFDEGGPIIGAADGETVAVWLVVEIASPDAAPIVVERALLDRLPATDRATGIFIPESVTPITVATNLMGEEVLHEFTALTIVQVECAGIPSQHIVAKLQNQLMFGPLEALGPGLAAIRNGLGLDMETGAGVWSYPSGPNVTAFTFQAVAPDTAEGELMISADILHRQRASIPLANETVSDTVHPLVLSGVLNAVAEEILLAPGTRGETGEASAIAPQPSIGAIFRHAVDTGVGIVVVSTIEDLTSVSIDPASAALISAAIQNGAIVVVPEQPVDLDGAPFTGWWIVDPLTGRTWDQLQNGRGSALTTIPVSRHSATAQDTLAWYARWAQYMAENVEFFARLGMTLGLVALIVETRILFPISAGAAAITGCVTVFGAGGLTLC